MSEKNLIRSQLYTALEDVQRWRINREDDLTRKSKSLDVRESDLKEQLSTLQAKMDQLDIEKNRIARDQSALPGQEVQKIRNAVVKGLEMAKTLLDERDATLTALAKSRDERVEQLISAPEMVQLVEEFSQFQRLVEEMQHFPESYRKAMLSHHQRVRTDLSPIFDSMNAPLQAADLNPGAISAVAFVDPPEGPPEALAILLPIGFEVYTDWAIGRETLKHKLLYRFNAALSGMLKKIGAPDAPIWEEDHNGFLMLSVYLGNSKVVGDVKNALLQEIETMKKAASEMNSVQLRLDAIWLPPEVIALDEGETDDES